MLQIQLPILFRKVSYIIIHCSASPPSGLSLKSLYYEHVKRQGWKNFGYHFYITTDGKIYPCRDINSEGAHAAGFNRNSIGVCYEGGLDANRRPSDTRTPEQKQALIDLLKYLRTQAPTAIILGHRDLPAVHKDCPCFNARTEYADI